jgi:hypothetical protein
VEEAGARPAIGLRHFDAHRAEREELIDEGPADSPLLVHVADQRPDALVRESADAVAEEPLVLGEIRDRRWNLGKRGGRKLRHGRLRGGAKRAVRGGWPIARQSAIMAEALLEEAEWIGTRV